MRSQLKKAYLVIDSRPASFGISLSLSKPDHLNPAANMITRLRKFSAKPSILSLWRQGNTSLLAIGTKSRQLYILLEKKPQVLIHLIDPETNTSLCRIGPKGSFSKSKTLEQNVMDLKSHRIPLESLFEPLMAPAPLAPVPGTPALTTVPSYQKQLRSSLKRRLKTIRKSLEKLMRDLPSPEQIESHKLRADMLRSFAHMAEYGDTDLEISPDLSGLEDTLIIPLDPDRKVGDNIDDYFHQLKKMQRKREISLDQIKKTKSNQAKLEETIRNLEQEPITLDESNFIAAQFKIRKNAGPSQKLSIGQSQPFNRYIALDQSEILVGKGAADNDELTKKAKHNDYWLHAIGTTGSHIIIPKSKIKGGQLGEATKREAAILALHFSKFRPDMAGEVYFTQRRDIRKKKGMPKGLWLVERSETYYCKYSQEELKIILDRQSST